MDAYPPDYVDHNLPLILLSGLGSDSESDSQNSSALEDAKYPLSSHGHQIFSDFPLVTDPPAEKLLNALLSEDASRTPWNSRYEGATTGSIGFRVKRVGRVGQIFPSTRVIFLPSICGHKLVILYICDC